MAGNDENRDQRYKDEQSGFGFYLTDVTALVPEILRNRPAVQVEFTVTAPWVLHEAAPE